MGAPEGGREDLNRAQEDVITSSASAAQVEAVAILDLHHRFIDKGAMGAPAASRGLKFWRRVLVLDLRNPCCVPPASSSHRQSEAG